MRCFLFFTFSVVFIQASQMLNSHEFWIDPTKFIVSQNDMINANIRVGTKMKGTAYGYYPRHFKRFEVFSQKGRHDVSGRLGDKPALSVPPQGNTLVTLIHESAENFVTYNEWQKFNEFLIEKDLAEIAKTHLSKKFVKTGFREKYIRYAKSLVGSGDSQGQDRLHDLEIEFVTQLNPYTSYSETGLPIKLYYKGEPLKKFQVEIFSQNQDGMIKEDKLVTNNNGLIILKTYPKTKYLLNAVKMREPYLIKPQKGKNLLLWESLWGSLTFMTPY